MPGCTLGAIPWNQIQTRKGIDPVLPPSCVHGGKVLAIHLLPPQDFYRSDSGGHPAGWKCRWHPCVNDVRIHTETTFSTCRGKPKTSSMMVSDPHGWDSGSGWPAENQGFCADGTTEISIRCTRWDLKLWWIQLSKT